MSEEQKEAKPLNIYQRLNKVREAVAYLRKDKEVANRYMAVTHDAVTAAVRKPFIEHGIMVVPNILGSSMVKSETLTAKGLPIWRYEAKYSIAFVNIDSPDDRVEIHIDSHALDEGDKAPGKAASYATKYAMLKLLSIETGEDEEGRMAQVKPEGVQRGKGAIHPDTGMWKSLTKDRQETIAKRMALIRDFFEADDQWGAYENWVSTKAAGFFESPEEEIVGWKLLKSEYRTTLKTMHKAETDKQKELEAKKKETA